ncbi:MAG TPA: TPM domain-containing protein [Candidatus Binatia bacterium]|nr:TPM domain-containing protein [Candidatus Binatia bacterium]
MKLRNARTLFAGLALLLAPTIFCLALALDVPPLRGRINDYAGLIPVDRARALEERLARFEAETGHQIAVLTIPSLEGDSLEDFSIRVAESWKIGKKGFDNGAILLVARDDRRLRIEVGYGLEGVMPDAIASRIIRDVITPRFRSGDYAGGIEGGVDAILKVTRGEKLPTRPASERTASQAASLMTILMITAMLALFIGLTRRRLLSGALGGAASGLATTLFASGGLGFVLFPALVVGALLGAVGAALGTGTAGNQWVGRPRSRQGDWGGGVFPGGFGGGGFGGGGGGFSGGGGGFGGGGASGSW